MRFLKQFQISHRLPCVTQIQSLQCFLRRTVQPEGDVRMKSFCEVDDQLEELRFIHPSGIHRHGVIHEGAVPVSIADDPVTI